MKTSVLKWNYISLEMVELIVRLITLIPRPERRRAMEVVTLSILDGKARLTEKEFVSIAFGASRKPRWKKHQKQTLVLENVWKINALADADPQTHRISVYTKATIQVG